MERNENNVDIADRLARLRKARERAEAKADDVQQERLDNATDAIL